MTDVDMSDGLLDHGGDLSDDMQVEASVRGHGAEERDGRGEEQDEQGPECPDGSDDDGDEQSEHDGDEQGDDSDGNPRASQRPRLDPVLRPYVDSVHQVYANTTAAANREWERAIRKVYESSVEPDPDREERYRWFERFIGVLQNQKIDEEVPTEEIEVLLKDWENWWADQSQTLHSIAVRGFMLSVGDFTIERLRDAYSTFTALTLRLQVICQARNLLNDDDVGGRNRTRLGRIEYTMRLAYELLEKEFDFRRCTNPVHGNMFVSRIQPLAEKIEKSKNNAQKLLLFLYEELGRLKYRRMHGCCYAQIYNKSGQATFAWKKVKTVEEFVYSYGDPNCAAYEFYSFGCGIPEMAIRRLLVDKSEYFPELKKNRYLFAYENGLADMFQFQFIPYDHCVIDNRVAVACRYIPTPFDPDWFDVRNLASIPTPEFNSVLEYQGLTDEVITIVKMFMGRCLYNLRTFDNWQAALYLVGLAGTGKSVVVETVGAFYEEDDVASFSNNIEKQFGLEKFLNKFVFVAPEIKSDMQLDPAQLQLMLEGTRVTIAKKNRQPEDCLWTLPGIFAGNEFLARKDRSGALQRRFALVEFVRKVMENDCRTDLQKRIMEDEIGALIAQCNVIYRVYAKAYGGLNLYAFLPKYFKETQRRLAVELDVFCSFMSDAAWVKQGDDLRVPLSDVQQEFTHFTQDRSMRVIWTESLYLPTFRMLNMAIIDCAEPVMLPSIACSNRVGPPGKYVVGMDLAKHHTVQRPPTSNEVINANAP